MSQYANFLYRDAKVLCEEDVLQLLVLHGFKQSGMATNYLQKNHQNKNY